MLIIGLTGGIGSGKSTVAALFAKKNIDIIDADHIARELVRPGTRAYDAIYQHFGSSIFNSDKTLDRKKLKQRIFSNSTEKKWLENLLHPLIRTTMTERALKAKSPYCILVIPLLFETEKNPIIDRILVVDTPPNIQEKRALARDDITPEILKKIIASQTSRQTRLAGADDVILNNSSLEALSQKVDELDHFYKTLTR